MFFNFIPRQTRNLASDPVLLYFGSEHRAFNIVRNIVLFAAPLLLLSMGRVANCKASKSCDDQTIQDYARTSNQAMGLFAISTVVPMLFVFLLRCMISQCYRPNHVGHPQADLLLNDFVKPLLRSRNALKLLDPNYNIKITDAENRVLGNYRLIDFAEAVGLNKIYGVVAYLEKLNKEKAAMMTESFMLPKKVFKADAVKCLIALGAELVVFAEREYIRLPDDVIRNIIKYLVGIPILQPPSVLGFMDYFQALTINQRRMEDVANEMQALIVRATQSTWPTNQNVQQELDATAGRIVLRR